MRDLQNRTGEVLDNITQHLQQRGMSFGMEDSHQAHENLTFELRIGIAALFQIVKIEQSYIQNQNKYSVLSSAHSSLHNQQQLSVKCELKLLCLF